MDIPRSAMVQGALPARSKQYPKLLGLEGLRGVMCLIVALAHFDALLMPSIRLFSRPALAVETFFVLSGLVIHYRYADDLNSGKLRYVSFLKKRIARLVPLHIFCLMLLLIVYAIGTLLVNIREQNSLSFLNYPIINDGRNYSDGKLYSLITDTLLLNGIGFHKFDATWNFPSWSVSSELFVSVALAALFLLPRLLVPIVSTLAIGFYLLLYFDQGNLSTHSRQSFLYIDVGLSRAIAGFCVGVLISLLFKKYDPEKYSLRVWVMEIPCAAALAWIIIFAPGGKYDFIALFPIAIIIFSVTQERSLLKRFLSFGALSAVGKYSYSLYLLHVSLIAIFSYSIRIFEFESVMIDKPLAIIVLVTYALVLIKISEMTYFLIEVPSRTALYDRINRPSFERAEI